MPEHLRRARLILTRHASDVLGGALTGVIAAVIVRAVYREDARIDRLITGIL